MKKNLIKGILYTIGAIMLGCIVISSDWVEIISQLKATPIKAIVMLLVFQCITLLLLGLQWKSLAAEISSRISFLDIILMNAKGSIMDSLTPGVKMGGELFRIFELENRAKISFADATIVVGLQKTFSLLSFLFLTLASLVWFSVSLASGHKYYLYLFTAAITAFSVIFAALILLSLKPDGLMVFFDKIFKNPKFREKIEDSLKKYSEILIRLFKNQRLFFSQMLLGIFIWSFYAFKLLVIVKSYNIHMDYITAAAITFLSYIMGMIPLLPGGIGSFESCMILLLKIKGLPMERAASIAIVFRLATFWFEFLLSAFIVITANILSISRGGKNAKVKV